MPPKAKKAKKAEAPAQAKKVTNRDTAASSTAASATTDQSVPQATSAEAAAIDDARWQALERKARLADERMLAMQKQLEAIVALQIRLDDRTLSMQKSLAGMVVAQRGGSSWWLAASQAGRGRFRG